MRELKQSTAANLAVFMTDGADHVTGKTGLTLAIAASKDGAAFASITPTVTELAYGWYKLALTTGHTDTLGDLALHVTATGADPTDLACRIIAIDKGNAASLGLSNLDATVSSRLATSGYTAPPTAASIATAVWTTTTAGDFTTLGSPGKVLVGQLGGTFTTSSSSVFSSTALANAPSGTGASAATIAAAVWDEAKSGHTTAGTYGAYLDAAITSRLAPTVSGRTLDVSTTGEAGIDWANVGSPTSTVSLSGTTVGTVTTYTGNTPQTGDAYARIGATGSGLTSLATAANQTTILAKTNLIPASPAAVGSAMTLDLTQPLADVKTSTVGGALHGAWAGAWGKMIKDVTAKTLKLFGIGSQSVAAITFDLDDGTAPTTRTPQ
jgi:hypothetical protein